MTAKGPIISTNRGAIVETKHGKASLTWNTNFQPRWQAQYSKAQKFMDSEILRLSEPFIPLLTGVLVKSGILGTDIGSGEVSWIAPYAMSQYYRSGKPGSQTGKLRGPMWFERMKEIHGDALVFKAKRIAGGG